MQFTVYHNPNKSVVYPFLLDVQSDIIDDLDKRMMIRKRAARTVLTGRCYSVGNATWQGSSSLTRFISQSAMTSRT